MDLLRDGVGRGDGGGGEGVDGDADGGDNLAHLRGGVAISSAIAPSIAGDKVTYVRTLFLGSEPGMAHQSQSDPHLMSHPMWDPPQKML
ncbi:hypothetical protein Tco_1129656 [Tanacetum coccineum]